ncbi:MAG: hypothetical protein IJK41_10235 [Muribaculaceae bacterium]|nr:hypothetical protein [Muribaculaceae bacterium]
MGALLLFILLIIFMFVGWPLLRGWLFVRDMRRKVNDTFGGRREAGSRRYEEDEEYTETGERKIYGSGEGEYAEFEDVSGTVIEETTWENETIIEEQVTDAEFEEIP